MTRPPRVDDGYVASLLPHVSARAGAPTSSAAAPFTGDPLPGVPQSDAGDVALAAESGREAQQSWAARPVGERARVVLRFAELVLRDRERLLDIVQWETGKSRVHAAIELLGLPSVATHYATRGPALLAEAGARSAVPGLVRTRVTRHPKGLVGVIAPWNYPLFLAVGDVLPALLAGNAVLSKADSQAPLTLLAARALAVEAGLPPEVWSVVAGRGSDLGPAILDEIDHLAFTGSTATGRELGAECGRRLIGASLELGGKNPMVVRADADLRAAVTGGVQACFSNAGQMCIGVERIYVDRAIHDEFVTRFAAAASAVTMGAAYDYSYEMGSLTTAGQLATTEAHVADALDRGAELVAGGKARPDLGPLFHEPTVLTRVTPAMLACTEETFGPVVAVHAVDGDEEAVALANDTEYGLSASVWSRDIDGARAVAARIRAGAVTINDGYLSAIASVDAPMGGMGASGLGRRHGTEGLLRYTEAQTVSSQRVATPYPDRPAALLTASFLAARAQLAAARLRTRRTS